MFFAGPHDQRDGANRTIECATAGKFKPLNRIMGTFEANGTRKLNVQVRVVARRDDSHPQPPTFADALNLNLLADFADARQSFDRAVVGPTQLQIVALAGLALIGLVAQLFSAGRAKA